MAVSERKLLMSPLPPQASYLEQSNSPKPASTGSTKNNLAKRSLILTKRNSTTRVAKAPPKANPHHCPECQAIGKYSGRQQQSENYTLIAWACKNGHHWGYTYPKNELPDATTLV
jgi:hypothetical protein